MNLGDFFRQKIAEGETQTSIARKCGISQSAVNNYLQGEEFPRTSTLRKIATAYKTPISFFINDTGPLAIMQPEFVDGIRQYPDPFQNEVDSHETLTRIPIWGSVPAGWPAENPITCQEDPLDYVVIKDPPEGSIGGLLVSGHSMSPDIKDGEYVLYVNAYDIRSGDIVVINDEFGKSMVKEYYEKDGEQWLRSINREYPDFKPNSHFRIMGRVIEVVNRRKIRRR